MKQKFKHPSMHLCLRTWTMYRNLVILKFYYDYYFQAMAIQIPTITSLFYVWIVKMSFGRNFTNINKASLWAFPSALILHQYGCITNINGYWIGVINLGIFFYCHSGSIQVKSSAYHTQNYWWPCFRKLYSSGYTSHTWIFFETCRFKISKITSF